MSGEVSTTRGSDWRESTLGMTICGASGAGKTTVARCLQHTFPGVSIFFDLDHESGFGTVVGSVEELRAALESGKTEIAVRPDASEVSEPELFEETVRFLLRFGNEIRGTDAGPLMFGMDEAQDLQQKWVKVALKRFRKRRIKPIAYTQDPGSLPTEFRNVADFNGWLSPPPVQMENTLRGIGYPVEPLHELNQYEMLVFGENWKPIDRVKAPEKYAE